MPEFFLALFSEEIPARMQAGAAAELQRRCDEALALLQPRDQLTWHGPRRIAYCATVDDATSALKGSSLVARGPRLGASERALEGFLNKHGATLSDLDEADGYYILKREHQSESAAKAAAEALPPRLAKFSWPKSMRWGQGGDFTWVRPLRRITCLLDGEVVPITLGPVTAADETEGHRFMAPGTFKVTSAADWQKELRERRVIVSADERKQMILEGLCEQAAERNLSLAEDEALLDEVTGLVEWPVPRIGCIDPQFMSLPPEVRELSMKVNQRYFALRNAAGKPAPFFAFVANIEAEDGGATIIAGNERVLRARLADAEHFWHQDRKHPLDDYLLKLKGVTFHAKLGSQYERAERIAALSREIAELLGAGGDSLRQAEIAGRLAKADLVTGMVSEFPELQGIMGGYYADDPVVGAAIRTHYQPKGPDDEVPHGAVPAAVALADKVDMLAGFFGIGEKPTGSGDPYALRRAALGVIRIIRENQISVRLKPVFNSALEQADHSASDSSQRVRQQTAAEARKAGLSLGLMATGFGRALSRDPITGEAIDPRVLEILGFIIERLRVLLRAQGERYDVLDAVFAAGADDDIVSLLNKAEAVSAFLKTEDGGNLLAAYRRAANILRIENTKDGPHEGEIADALLSDPAERELNEALKSAETQTVYEPGQRGYGVLLTDLAKLRAPVDKFFEAVKINAEQPELRQNRLRLLARLRDTMHTIANFSKIEG